MTLLLLVRHGANDLQKEGLLAGWTPHVHLNQEGRAQAQAIAHRLAQLEVAAIYASPLERTMETAEIIAAPHGLTVTVCEELGEVHYGRWAGEPLEKLRRRRLWRAVQFTPATARFPGGESLREMQARAVAQIEALRAKHAGDSVVVVSHADVIKSVVAYYVGLHLNLFQRLVIAPASLTALGLDGPVPHLICLNDTGHLAQPMGGVKK